MHRFIFEFLPVEILHGIFDYLWTNEIFYSFLNINSHLDHVILSYPSSFVNFHSILRPSFDLTCHRLRPDQVISLVLSDGNDTPGQCQLFLSRFAFEQFNCLRSLKLIEIDRSIESLMTALEKMEHLRCLEINAKYHNQYLNILPQLTRFVVKYDHVIYFENSTLLSPVNLPHLRHLSLTYCSYFQLEHIFRHATMLISLNISIIFESRDGIQSFIHCNDGRPPIGLTTLVISIDVSRIGVQPNMLISRIHLQEFLYHIPRLRRLELIVNNNGSNNLSYGNLWEIFITERLPLLKKFDFKFQLENAYRNKDFVKDSFSTPFWLAERRPWFIVYDHGHSILFTVPRFIPRSTLYSATGALADCTTLPLGEHTVFNRMVTQLTFDSIEEQPLSHYAHVEELIQIGFGIGQALIDFSRVQSLSINLCLWTLGNIVHFVRRSMPRLNQLSLNCQISLRCSASLVALHQVRILRMPFLAYSLVDGGFDWCRIFPSIERLWATVNSCDEMAFLIDQFENMSYASFIVNSCSRNARKSLRERRIGQEWLVENTVRFSMLDSNSFSCKFDDTTNNFTVYLWIGGSVVQNRQVFSGKSVY